MYKHWRHDQRGGAGNGYAASDKRSIVSNRVYHQTLSIGNHLAMSALSEESRQIVASLAHRIGANADIAAIARAIVSTLQGMDAALTPIIGHQGGAALYRRSLQLCTSRDPRLAGIYDRAQVTFDLNALKQVLLEQSEADALLFGEVMLTTFYELLTTLIGPSLTARLLRDVWEPPLSDTPSQENSP
jgi:hypothetical protein